MTSADFVLQAFMADNDASERGKRDVVIELRGPTPLAVERVSGDDTVQSTYKWSIDDASLIGVPRISDADAAKVFAIALSMQSWRVFHSPVILQTVTTLQIRTRAAFSASVSNALTTGPVVISGDSFARAADGLQAVFAMPGTRGDILRESLNSYWDALHSVHTRSRFISLWCCLERAVNEDGRRRDGATLDAHAARATGQRQEQIQQLRELNKRLKHADSVARAPSGFAAQAATGSGELKQLVDHALADRLGFSFPSTYDPRTA